MKIAYNHSHKKRKDSMETRAKLAILCSYVHNQAMLEPILLSRASKCKQTKEQGSEDCLWTHFFLPFYKIIVSFFLSSVKMQTKQDQTVL